SLLPGAPALRVPGALLPRLPMPRQTFLEKKAVSAVLQHAIQEALQLTRLVLGEAAQKAVQNSHRTLPHLRKRLPALLGQLDVHQPPVIGIAPAADQTLALQAIDHARHGARVVGNTLAQL